MTEKNDILYVDPLRPTKDRGFNVKLYDKPTEMLDTKKKAFTTRLEIGFGDVDERDYQEIYGSTEYRPKIVCYGGALLFWIPQMDKWVLKEMMDEIKEETGTDSNKLYRYNELSSNANDVKAMRPRPVLLIMPEGMIVSNNVQSRDFPNKDQPVMVYLQPVKRKVKYIDKDDGMEEEADCYSHAGYVILHVVSEKPKNIDEEDESVAGITDAMKGMNV